MSCPTPTTDPPAAGAQCRDDPLRATRAHDRRGALAPLAPPEATAEAVGTTALLAARLDRVIAECRRFQTPMAVLSVHIDAIESVGVAADAPGIESAIAVEFGHRLRGRVRTTDPVLWLGGRDYAVVLLHAGGPTALLVRARLAAALAGAYRIDDRLAGVVISIGHAVYPLDGTQGNVLASIAVAERRPV